MGVSYEISRREGIIGGPEKPISELGRRGYDRFWSSEIARWLLDQDVTPAKEIDSRHDVRLTVQDVSQGTWIVAKDCLDILRSMNIAERVDLDAHLQEEDIKSIGVRIDKASVRRWLTQRQISLARAVDPEGFVDSSALGEARSLERESILRDSNIDLGDA